MELIYLNILLFIIFTALSNSDILLYQIVGNKIQAVSASVFLHLQSSNCKPTMILLS